MNLWVKRGTAWKLRTASTKFLSILGWFWSLPDIAKVDVWKRHQCFIRYPEYFFQWFPESIIPKNRSYWIPAVSLWPRPKAKWWSKYNSSWWWSFSWCFAGLKLHFSQFFNLSSSVYRHFEGHSRPNFGWIFHFFSCSTGTFFQIFDF